MDPTWTLTALANGSVEIHRKGRLHIRLDQVAAGLALSRLRERNERDWEVFCRLEDVAWAGVDTTRVSARELGTELGITPGRVSQLRQRAWTRFVQCVEALQPHHP